MKRPKLRVTLALAILLHSTFGQQQQTGLFNQNPFGGVQTPQQLQQGFRIQQPLPGRNNILNPQIQVILFLVHRWIFNKYL